MVEGLQKTIYSRCKNEDGKVFTESQVRLSDRITFSKKAILFENVQDFDKKEVYCRLFTLYTVYLNSFLFYFYL